MSRTAKRICAGLMSLVMVLTLFVQMPAKVNAEDVNLDLNPYGGTDYYLDYSGGDDLNSGTTPAEAWQNLTKANESTFQPGDRILLKCGETWNDQQLWPKGSGEEGKPITIDWYGDSSLGRPYIATNGNVEYPLKSGTVVRDKDKVGLTGAIVLRNQQYWEIHHMELSNDDDFDTDITRGNYVRDGISVSINADYLEDGEDNIMNYFRITDNYIHDIDGISTWQQIHYGGICFQVFGENRYTDYAENGYYFQDVVIENNSFYKTELHAIQFAFNWFYDRYSNQGQYDDDGKYHEGWEQLWVRTRNLYSRDVYIGHNYCESIGQGAIQLANTKDMTVEYNEVNGFLERYNAVSCGLYLWAGADSVMQYNEVYNGPYDEYDGTPWDMEYTNFEVVYQYNYSHDNKAGWMSYMGNSSNSIARYNLSVNDNGVIVKNMLSTNYQPSYFVNNVFVYDADQMDYFHDEVFKSTVYFYNNVFYNYSESTTTPWYRRDNALANAVFSNNVYYEASGETSDLQPTDKYGIYEDPQFVIGDPSTGYAKELGVDNIVQSASLFKLENTSPLIDAGHFTAACGSEDFFATELYYGDEIDIGIYEAQIGEKVDNPVEKELDDDEPERVNLALNKDITASYTHSDPYAAKYMVDGDLATRWACADPSINYPIEIVIDFGEETEFNEVFLDEYTDSGTELRIEKFTLKYWDEDSSSWVTFKEVTDGMGHNLTIDDFGTITSSKLMLSIESQLSNTYWTPTITEIQVYMNALTYYTVSFSGAEVETQSVLEGATATEPEAPTLDGYTFTGWYSDEDCTKKYDFAAAVTADTVIYAGWEKVEIYYTVSFSGAEVVSQSVLEGATATEPEAPTLEGYTFTGWYSDEECETLYDFTAAVTADTVIYAGWEENEVVETYYSVSFSGAEVVSQSVLEGATATEPEAPTLEGYTFTGWYSDEACETLYDFTAYVTADTVIYAGWEENEVVEIYYTVSFSGAEVESQSVLEGESATEPEEPTLEGYTFTGWYSDEACTTKYDFTTSVTVDTVIYAGWAENEVHKNITFITGYENNTFKPDGQITRAEFAQMIYNIAGKPEASYDGSFSDVKKGDWYYDAVMYLAGTGVITGYPEGTFEPDQGAIRAEIATMVVRYLGLDEGGTPSFTDVKSDYWAIGFIAAAEDAGLVEGKGEGLFEPETNMTRAETVTLLNRALENVVDKDAYEGVVMPFSDVEDDNWAWADIMTAVLG